MATATPTHPAQDPHVQAEAPLTLGDQELLERLDTFDVRLELADLATVMAPHDDGHTSEQIAATMKLHPIVVRLEVRRELERRKETPPLTVREWNGLAAGTHVPSKQLREMIDTAVRFRDGLSRSSVINDAGIKDSCYAHRLLGYKPWPGYTRTRQTIACEYAAGIANALGRAPVEVQGL